MIIILIIFFTGIFIGHFFKKKKKIIRYSDKLVEISVFLLLIFLGVMVGKNDKIILSIHTIGFKALVITVFAMMFSIMFAYFFYKFNNYDK
jgi:uncharacterized membrane protein YbjE (DUF340 family)